MRIHLYKTLLRVVFWLALSLYLGGLVALGAVAAPSIFHKTEEFHALAPSLPDLPNSPAHRQLGGELFGDILARFTVLETIALAVLLIVMILLHAYTKKWAWRIGLLLIFLLGAVYFMNAEVTTSLLRSRNHWRQAATQPQPEITAARRTEFDALHQRSELLAQIKVYLLLGLLVVGVTMDNQRDKPQFTD